MLRGSRSLAGAVLPAVLLALTAAGCGGGGSHSAAATPPAVTAPAGGVATRPAPTSPAGPPRTIPRPAGDRTPLVFHGPRGAGEVALTFDADMTPQMRARLDHGEIKSSYDTRIIRTLRGTRTPATIFAAGMWIERYPDQTRELVADPLFEFANHSYRHSAFTHRCYGLAALRIGEMAPDVERTTRLLDRYAPGHPPYFRFPGGCFDRAALKAVAPARVVAIQWDVISGDAFGRDPDLIVRNVLSGAKAGSIVVMHLNGAPTAPQTFAALPRIITGLKAKGLRMVKLSEMLT